MHANKMELVISIWQSVLLHIDMAVRKILCMVDGFPFYGLLGIPPTISISRLLPQVWHECPLLATAGTATSTTLVRTATTGRPRRTRRTRTTPTTWTSIPVNCIPRIATTATTEGLSAVSPASPPYPLVSSFFSFEPLRVKRATINQKTFSEHNEI